MNKTKYPIYILSKGRCNSCLTAKIFIENDIDFYIVVEPEEFKEYREKFGHYRVLSLTRNNQGIAYVRNQIKENSISQGNEYHWQIDDNIKSFRKRIDNKNIKVNPFDMFIEIENFVSQYNNIGGAGLMHTAFAFAAKKDISINKQIYSCVLLNNSVDISYRKDVVEDTDYSLQMLSKGYSTVLFNRLLIDKATTLSMSGGNTEIEYGNDGRMKRSLGLQKHWPGWFQITEQYGRPKVKPSRIWRTFNQQLIKKEIT